MPQHGGGTRTEPQTMPSSRFWSQVSDFRTKITSAFLRLLRVTKGFKIYMGTSPCAYPSACNNNSRTTEKMFIFSEHWQVSLSIVETFHFGSTRTISCGCLAYIRKVLGSNIGGDTNYPDRGFHRFSQSLPRDVGILP
jgi:hypothetical protein